MNNFEQIEKLESEIRGLKLLLSQTDYQCLKYTEGCISPEDYEEIRLYRQSLRDKINFLQDEIENLNE